MNLEQTEEFAVYWTQAQPAVMGYISAFIRDYHQAEDVLHQVAISLVRKFDQYDREQRFVAWALSFARLEVLRHRRKYSTDKHQFSDDVIEIIATRYGEMADEIDDRRRALGECLNSLGGRFLQALRLCYFEELKPKAAGERLQMTPVAFRALLYRARTALRQCIERRISFREGTR